MAFLSSSQLKLNVKDFSSRKEKCASLISIAASTLLTYLYTVKFSIPRRTIPGEAVCDRALVLLLEALNGRSFRVENLKNRQQLRHLQNLLKLCPEIREPQGRSLRF